ncbi:hypothetical protein Zmor_008109 [Zophobas morio]|uniref:Uncharacterized protein n=1 Tax=Zophobas morio TaxID=2755281 RepID=A0AA38IZK6_9CUCU|nr:hypothetical protein Zmor_008109 [Zophobas morio]
MAPILYMVPPNPGVRAVLITAKAIGLELELKEVNMPAGEHLKPDFIKINPQHSIPTLVDDDGFTVWDSHAIITYLVSKYAETNQRLFFEQGVVFSRLFKIADPIIQNKKKQLSQKDIDSINEIYSFLEALLDGRKWIADDCVTVADYSLISSVSSFNVLLPIDGHKYPRTSQWFENCESLPEYEANKHGIELFSSVVKNKLVQ